MSVTKKPVRRRILSGDDVVAHFDGHSAELTKQGAKWWDISNSRSVVREPIYELATRLGKSIWITYKGRQIAREYPHAQHSGNPKFTANMRDASRRDKNKDMGYRTIAEIKAANKRAGYHWFEPASMRFFKSKVLPTVYRGRYFISSEQAPGPFARRVYTVREANPDGSIDTVGKFQGYATAAAARKAINAL